MDSWGLLILPENPSGLPDGWIKDPTHKNPNGEKWIYPKTGDELEWHPKQKGKPGWRGKDHWYHNRGKKHLPPGTEVPDPQESCNIDNTPSWQSSLPKIEPKPWWILTPILIPLLLNPFSAP